MDISIPLTNSFETEPTEIKISQKESPIKSFLPRKSVEVRLLKEKGLYLKPDEEVEEGGKMIKELDNFAKSVIEGRNTLLPSAIKRKAPIIIEEDIISNPLKRVSVLPASLSKLFSKKIEISKPIENEKHENNISVMPLEQPSYMNVSSSTSKTSSLSSEIVNNNEIKNDVIINSSNSIKKVEVNDDDDDDENLDDTEIINNTNEFSDSKINEIEDDSKSSKDNEPNSISTLVFKDDSHEYNSVVNIIEDTNKISDFTSSQEINESINQKSIDNLTPITNESTTIESKSNNELNKGKLIKSNEISQLEIVYKIIYLVFITI